MKNKGDVRSGKRKERLVKRGFQSFLIKGRGGSNPKQLRQVRRREAAVNKCWKTYREKRRQVNKVIRKEKEKNRKNKLQKIKEQGGPSCKLFWSDLQGKKNN